MAYVNESRELIREGKLSVDSRVLRVPTQTAAMWHQLGQEETLDSQLLIINLGYSRLTTASVPLAELCDGSLEHQIQPCDTFHTNGSEYVLLNGPLMNPHAK